MRNEGLDDLDRTLDSAAALVAVAPAHEAELVARLEDIYRRLFLVDFADYDIDGVREAGPALRRRICAIHLGLRERIPDWAARGLMTRPVQTALRDVFRVARYARDLVG
ncbi:MAG: hypothetical protein SFW09_00925 [Hyphomicrobiaceae bacterium]|nr:hypothetical protein [Hyphomicrobiaceae bacterium]